MNKKYYVTNKLHLVFESFHQNVHVTQLLTPSKSSKVSRIKTQYLNNAHERSYSGMAKIYTMKREIIFCENITIFFN